ncbi:hypothetical protein CKO31_15395 [Thiohalocapsa halophila]|uniref:SDR family NAD(P)-dependent oxidoreductase n=1 Tax=Thiohalocapsa halophila TaxID=69359 RepID=A0ABS1CK75_9GAMM|nr:SDR family NAD(P)-dependent oxidoreductase [Thiohalocapsa halophila]MBK1632098.1 hypothetical protein [Thiohalocapsa halophila]
MTLGGKTALVTGSTSGIGLGIAKGFAEAGINVVINGFGDATAIDEERAGLEAHGVKAVYHGADMSKPEAIAAMMDSIVEEFGQLDILVNNAGIQHVAPVEGFPPEKWDAILAINLSSAFHTIRAAIPSMKQAGWGRIINQEQSSCSKPMCSTSRPCPWLHRATRVDLIVSLTASI